MVNYFYLDFFKKYWLLLVFIVFKFILQFHVINPVYELHRDEFLHLDQARHLAFGFISVPPFTALISKIIFLFGGGVFWVRFFPALFGALTLAFAWFIVEELGGKFYAKLLVSGAVLFSALVRLNILFQPNSFDILAWTIIIYLLVKYVKSQKHYLLYILAFIIALAFYNKYNVLFLLTGLLLSITVTNTRKTIFNYTFLKALLVLIALLLPNIIWQILHNFPVIKHMQVLKATQLDNTSGAEFLKIQCYFFAGSVVLCLGALWALFVDKSFRNFRFVGLALVLVIVIFTLLKAKAYYSIGIYPALFAFGSVWLEKITPLRLRHFILPVVFLLNILVFISMFSLVHPVLSPMAIQENKEKFEKFGFLKWEDGKNHHLPQDFADMLGWKEMAFKAYMAYNMIPESERANTIIHCDNYGQTGAVNYYNRGKMPEAFAFNTDYIFWIIPKERIQNIILIGEAPDKHVLQFFESCVLVGKVENRYARERGTQIYILKGAKKEVREIYYGERTRRIMNFDIF